jgi:hypothetical protein
MVSTVDFYIRASLGRATAVNCGTIAWELPGWVAVICVKAVDEMDSLPEHVKASTVRSYIFVSIDLSCHIGGVYLSSWYLVYLL